MGGFTEVSLAGAEAVGEAAAAGASGGTGLLEQMGSGLTSALDVGASAVSEAGAASPLAPTQLDGLGEAAANLGPAPNLTSNLLDDFSSGLGADPGMASPSLEGLAKVQGGDQPLSLASGIADAPASIGSGKDVAAPKSLFGGQDGLDDASPQSSMDSRAIRPQPQQGNLLERLSGGDDPLMTPDPEFKIPKIPDKMWEEAEQFRAAMEAQTVQAPTEQAPQADWWQARNMAEAVDGRGNFDGVAKHYATQAQSDPHGTRAEIEAVTRELRSRNSTSADSFRTRMEREGLMGTPSRPIQLAQANTGTMNDAGFDYGPATPPANSAVTRDMEVLKNPENIQGYSQWLAGAAKTDSQWATEHGRALSRELYKSDPLAAEGLARHAEQSGLDLYAKGYQTPRGGEQIEQAAKANGGWIAHGGDKSINGGKECVALVKAEVPELRNVSTKAWTRGEDIRGLGDPPLKPGTAIAYGWDAKGNYPSNSTGNHAMIYLGLDKDNPGMVKVIDQHGPRSGSLSREGRGAWAHSIPVDKLLSYSVIRLK